MAAPPKADELYGLLAEFEQGGGFARGCPPGIRRRLSANERLHAVPARRLVTGAGQKPTRLPLLMLLGGILGGSAAYFMLYYASVISYPINVGGRPLHSWPAFIPITFEMTVLGASFAAFFGMLALNGLPHPYHPLFNVPAFKLASRDRFFLCIQARDPLFNLDETRQFLEELGAKVYEVQP